MSPITAPLLRSTPVPATPADAAPVRAAAAAKAPSDTVTISNRALAAQASAPSDTANDLARQFAATLAARLFDSAAAEPLPAGQNASFTASGRVSTSDGQAFEYEAEAEVRYPAGAAGTRDTMALTGRQLPEVKFPGSLSDLFKLFDQAVQANAPRNPIGQEAGETGVLALRLLRLVNSAALLAPRARPDDPHAGAADRSRALAASYGAAPAATAELARA